MNIAVLASHGGSDLQAIIDACRSNRINAKVCAVISNNSGSFALQRARDNGIPAFHLSIKTAKTADALESEILATLANTNTQFIFLAGYLKKLGTSILKTYKNRVFNIHPSLLPKYGGKGMYGLNIHEAVLAANETETGITIHRVDSEYDTGSIIAQTKVPVKPNDTPESLAARVLEREHSFIIETLEKIIKELNMNPYKQCPTYETQSFIIRLVKEEDAQDLLSCYSDPKAQALFNIDGFPHDCKFNSSEEMLKYIKFWLKEYAQEAYVRFSIIEKSTNKAIGTIEMFGMVGRYKTDPGILRVDIASVYENEVYLKEIFDICITNFHSLFEVKTITTKAPPIATTRIQVLHEAGFKPHIYNGKEHYYSHSN